MNKLISKLLATGILAASLAIALPALASSIQVGNAPTNRSNLDSYTNFTVVDSNVPASASGTLGIFTYYATNTNPFEFLLVDSGNVVQWISPTITPSLVGINTWNAPSAVNVQAGWNIGAHFDSTSTIPFDLTGAPAFYSPNNDGIPVISVLLPIEGTSTRTYSIEAVSPVVSSSTTSTATSTGSISGTVYNDLNQNGAKNVGEPTLSGWTINLYNNAGFSGPTNKPPFMTIVSDVNGNYTFANLPDGIYSVEEISQAGSLHQFTSDYSSIAISNGSIVSNMDFGNIVGNSYSNNSTGKGHASDQGNGNQNKGNQNGNAKNGDDHGKDSGNHVNSGNQNNRGNSHR